MVGHWLGWISFVFCILILAKYIGRISKNKTLNSILKKIHKPLGITVIGVAAIHGITSYIEAPQVSVTSITGIILFALIIMLARTFYARKNLKAKWFQMHRHLSIILSIMIVIHVLFAI